MSSAEALFLWVGKAKTTADPLQGWQARKAPATTKTTVLRGNGSDSGADEVGWKTNSIFWVKTVCINRA
jgi:hypothetical protein